MFVLDFNLIFKIMNVIQALCQMVLMKKLNKFLCSSRETKSGTIFLLKISAY